jgi:tetrahydromethanopterin S-methyltransferase subunit G
MQQTTASQDQLNRIENELQHVKELLELLIGKIAQQEGKELDETPNEYFNRIGNCIFCD